jgi:phage terminase small subunit
MGARGKKSAAELTVIDGGRVGAQKRPEPPDHFDDDHAAIWRKVVARLPADWFPDETLPLLEAYCYHVAQLRQVSELIADMLSDKDGFEIKDYDRLSKMQERETRAIASLAVKMRISQSTAYDKSKKRGSAGNAKKPWES